nr:zinc finger, CCHC-type [Tanacetum cinerariifolium]
MAEDASSKKFLKDFKHTLKHLKEELTLVELDSHLRIEESLRVQDSDKPNGNNVVGPLVVNMVEHNNSSRDAIFNENRFSSVPRPSLRFHNEIEDIGGSLIPEEVTKEVVQQPEPELRKIKRNRTPKNFGLEF